MSLVGIDIGNSNCKMAVREGSSIRLVDVRMPENMVHEGEMSSPEMLAQFLRQLRADEHIRNRDCALVLDTSQVFFRHVSLPPMNVSELMLNLPYEFRDFITGDPESYVYDYAVDDIVRDDAGDIVRMELFSAAVPKTIVESYSTTLKKAGFKLKMVTPAPMVYTRLLRAHAEHVPEDAEKDVVLVDIGYQGVIVSLFRGLHYDSSRIIDFGCGEFDQIIADLKGIDAYTAGSYKFTNFEGVLDEPECQALCGRFAMEVSKVVNFYNFNNPEREIEHLYFMGGGASIPQLTSAIAEAVSVTADNVTDLLPSEVADEGEAPVCALAIGCVLEGEAM